MNQNMPPFAQGQEIICIKDHSALRIKKGERFRAEEVIQCKCGMWVVVIGYDPRVCSYHTKCGKKFKGLRVGAAYFFAPIETQYTDITKELADSVKQTDEVPDKLLIPQTN